MFLRNSVLIFCFAVSTIAIAQQETYKLFPTCFSDTNDQFGVRKVGNELYVLSNAFDSDSNLLIDKYTNKPYTDLYRVDSCKLKIATLQSAQIGEEALLSSPKYDGPISSDKGMSIIFFSNNNEKLIGDKMGIFYLIKTENGWSESFAFPLNSERYNVIHPFYSEETGRVYFASDMQQGKGGFDIYSIEFDGVEFGKISSEDSINTTFNETFPQYAHGRIYFTSDGHNSVGGLDVFFSQAGEIIHLPEPMNTVYDDFDVHFIDKSSGFLSTNRGYEGASDQVYYFIQSTQEPAEQLIAKKKELLAAQQTKLKLTEEVIEELVSSNSDNTLYKALHLSANSLIEQQDAIANQLYKYESRSQEKLAAINNEIEALILADESIDYTEKSFRLSELSTMVNGLNKSQSTEKKQKLLRQLSDKVLSKLDNQPTSLLSKLASYKNDLASLAELESQQRGVNQGINSLASILQQESVKSAIESPALAQLIATTSSDNNAAVGSSTESKTLARLNQDKADQIKLQEYESQQMLLLDKYKRQLVNDIISDTAKSAEEKLAVIGQINTLLASSGSFKNIAEIKALASQVSNIQEKTGFKSSTNATNEFNDLIKLANENTYIIEKSKTDPTILANSSENNQAVQKVLTSIENSLLKQLVAEGKLNQVNTDKVAQILNTYAQQLSNTKENQVSIRLTKELNQALVTVDSSLNITEEKQLELLASQKNRTAFKQFHQLENQLAYANLQALSLEGAENKRNANKYVGIVQLHTQPYQMGKLIVKDADGAIIDSLFTDENGVFMYHSLKSTNVTIEPFNSSESDAITFYDVDGANLAINKMEQIYSNTTKSDHSGILAQLLIDSRIKSEKGNANLSLFIVRDGASSEHYANAHITENSNVKLSNAFMTTLIANYKMTAIQFRFDSYQVQRRYEQELNELVKFLVDYHQFAIVVKGHTDIIGDAAYNQLLSEKRAIAVKRYLVRKGLSDESFVVKGYGPKEPVSSNDTEEGRKRNRRVEIRLEVK